MHQLMVKVSVIGRLILIIFLTGLVGSYAKGQDTTKLDVAVLLPWKFNIHTGKESIRKNLPLLDFYDGLRLGSLHLSEKGLAISFHHYDTERSLTVVEKVLKLPDVQKSKLWIGPVFSPEANKMAEAAQASGAIMVNPLSSKISWDTANKAAFLFQNSLSNAAKVIAANSKESLPCDKVIVFYDADAKDSVFAFEYKKEIELLGGKVIVTKRVGKKDKIIVGSVLRASKADSTGHILLASSREQNHVQLLAALKLEGLKIPIITTDAWLETSEHTVEDLESAKLRFYYPFWSNRETLAFKRFESEFISLYGRVPSEYAIEGYELLMRYAKLSAKYGRQASTLLRLRGRCEGVLLSGYDYSKTSGNGVIPYFEFQDRVLKPVTIQVKQFNNEYKIENE